MPLKPSQSHCPVFARGSTVPSKTTCAQNKSPIAIIVRYTLTLNEPNLLPADVKNIQLAVQRHEVRIAAESPVRFEFKFLTVRVKQHDSCNLKPFSPFTEFRRAQAELYAFVT